MDDDLSDLDTFRDLIDRVRTLERRIQQTARELSDQWGHIESFISEHDDQHEYRRTCRRDRRRIEDLQDLTRQVQVSSRLQRIYRQLEHQKQRREDDMRHTLDDYNDQLDHIEDGMEQLPTFLSDQQ